MLKTARKLIRQIPPVALAAFLAAIMSTTTSSAEAQWRVHTVAGTGTSGLWSELANKSGQAGTLVMLNEPYDLDTAPDGSLYFANDDGEVGRYEKSNGRVYLHVRRRPGCFDAFTDGMNRTASSGVLFNTYNLGVGEDEDVYVSGFTTECNGSFRDAVYKVDHATGQVTRVMGGALNFTGYMNDHTAQASGGWDAQWGLDVIPGRYGDSIYFAAYSGGPGIAFGYIGTTQWLFTLSLWSYKTSIYAGGTPVGGEGKSARYANVYRPSDLAVHDGSYVTYFIERGRVIRKIQGAYLWTVGTLSGARGITVDDSGTRLYITTSAHEVWEMIIATGAATRIAGVPGVAGNVDGPGATAKFNNPTGIAWHGTFLYVADRDNGTIRIVYQEGTGTGQIAVCGDGIITPPETCDDGNQISGDGCAAQCLIEFIE